MRRTLKRGLDCLHSPVLKPLLLKHTNAEGRRPAHSVIVTTRKPLSKNGMGWDGTHVVIGLGQGIRIKSP